MRRTLTPDGRLDAVVDLHQQVAHAVAGHALGVEQSLEVQGVPADGLVLPRDVDLHAAVPHGPGELAVRRVHGQEQPGGVGVREVGQGGGQVNTGGRGWEGSAHLKLGCGVTLGVFPSMTPRSLMVREPPGSSSALSRSRTEALQGDRTNQ